MNKEIENCQKAKKQFIERGHHAELILDNEDITVIDWINKNNGSDYYVRYILSRTDHRQNISVLGDLGDAIFEFFWNREDFSIESFARKIPESNIYYWLEKLQASSDLYDYNSYEAEISLSEHLKSYFENEDDWDTKYYDNLKELVSDCMEDFNHNGFGSKAYDIVSDIDCDCWEWLPYCGRKLNFRYYLWIVGLVMACKQIASERIMQNNE